MIRKVTDNEEKESVDESNHARTTKFGGSLLKRLLFVLIGLLFINIPHVNY
jgi:hypothetical protein